jgi:hypothetical protein
VAKITLSTIGSRYGSIDALNANFDAIEEAFENTVSRDGTGPNFLQADLDANSNRIINLPAPIYEHEAVNKGYLDEVVSIVAEYVDAIDLVAANIQDVVALAPVAPFLDEYGNQIVSVGNNIDEVVEVANNIGSVQLVGLELNGAFQTGVIYDFGAITDDPLGAITPSASSIVIVANNIDDVITVSESIEDVQAVAAIADSLQDVINNETNINAVAAISTEVQAVAAIADEVVAVDANEANINAAVANETNINAVAGNATNINTVAGNSTNINTVAGNTTNINAVAANNTDITTVAGVISNVNTVATSITNVNTVATNIADVNTVAINIVDVQNAEENADAAIAAKAAAEAARDAALAALDSFDDRYLGQKTADPTLDNDGDPLLSGALYFNTVDNVMKVYDGTIWLAAYASLAGALIAANNLSDLTNTVTARSNLGLGTAATTDATAYATATQGTNADTAYGWGNHALVGYLTGIPNGSVTSEKLAATLDFGSIV